MFQIVRIRTDMPHHRYGDLAEVEYLKQDLEELVSKIDRLPAPDPVALEVIQLCAEKDVTISRLVQIIATDQSLTSQILRIANSSYFNYPKTIFSVERAIIILGLNLLKDIALSIAFYSFYKNRKTSASFDAEKLWHHSILTAIIAKALAQRYDSENRQLYYVAGLLHDVGKLIEAEYMEEDFYFFIEKCRSENIRLDQAELKFQTYHHGDVGGMLIERWNMPEMLVKMVKYHHHPSAYEGDPAHYRLICFIYLSNLLAHYVHEEMTSLDELRSYDPDFMDYFSYTEEELEDLICYIKETVEQNQQYFEVHQI